VDGLEVTDVEVRYGRDIAVTEVSLAVAADEIVAVIGPSGCGKSSLLRAVAGLEPLERGTIRWRGDDLRAVPAHERGFGLMFQDHALFPHRDVSENIAFGLKMQHRPRAEQDTRVTELLALVGLEALGSRRIDELSGGEAQRVALARALAPRPRLLMLDEPLGSLDRSLRERLALDIRSAVRAMGVAALHVTHDQDEAFTVADRVAVMHAGHLVQIDTPQQLWRSPRTVVVARFLGHHVVSGAVAGALGLLPHRAGHDGTATAVVLLPGALEPDPAGAVLGVVRDVRFTSLVTRALIDVPAAHATVPVSIAHGAPAAAALLDARPGDPISLRADPHLVVPVAGDLSP
jgi:thiamine transport system ATP-binding protein